MRVAVAVAVLVGVPGLVPGTPTVRWFVAAVLGTTVLSPVAGAAIGVAGGALIGRRRLADRRRSVARQQADVAVLADLLVLAFAAGLPIRSALVVAAERLDGELAAEVRDVVDLADRRGIGVALAEFEGAGARLFRLLGRAVATGAPVLPAVEAHAAELRHAEHSRLMADARRLPVRLLLPLALLILPGFVVLAVGPALIDAMHRLGGGS